MKNSKISKLALVSNIRKIISVCIFIIIWELLVNLNVMHPLMFGNIPSPVDVFKTFIKVLHEKIYYQHIVASFLRIAEGSLFALPVAVILGLLMGLSKIAKDIILPIFDLFRPIPQIAWIPLSILMFHSVEQSITFITFLGAFFPILVNTFAGTANVNNSLITAAKSMNATRWQLIRFVYIPSVVPSIFTGFTVGVGTCWMSVIAAEMISGKYGIGYYTWTSYTLMSYSETIVGMITIGIMGTVCFVMIRILERFLLKWRENNGG